MEVHRTYYLHNLGCAKNQVEGEHLAGILIQDGWEPTQEPQAASLVVVNTCGFLQAAVEEAIDTILELAEYTKQGRLVVVGCLVGRYGKKLAQEMPEVDLWVGPGETHRLIELLALSDGAVAMAPPRHIFDSRWPRALGDHQGWAWLRVADGCAHRCAFCAIPGIRGRLRSRKVADLVAEARQLADLGVVELNLVAQDLASFGRDTGESLLGLCRELQQVEGVQWLRLLYMHPDLLEVDDILKLWELPKVLPYLDVPLQHIADPVLTAMGRRRGGGELRRLLTDIRARAPQTIFRTTALVGHPGEDEAAFEELLAWVKEFGFDHLGAFAYSPESGTRAARLARPEAEVAQARQAEVLATQAKISRERLRRWVGRDVPAIILGEHPESELLAQARAWFQAPEVDGEIIITQGQAEVGDIRPVKINASHEYDLEGEIVSRTE